VELEGFFDLSFGAGAMLADQPSFGTPPVAHLVDDRRAAPTRSGGSMATLALLVLSVDVPRRNQLYSRRRITYMDGELMLSPRLQVTTCGCCWGYGPMFE
jgi:hypothetical protein